jgi:hypothetical protein
MGIYLVGQLHMGSNHVDVSAVSNIYFLNGGLSRPRTYPFFEDIYPILYHGQKSDIISYPISRQKNEKGYISYILSNFIFAKVYLLILETFV